MAAAANMPFSNQQFPDHLGKLDQILDVEERASGKRVFKRGQDLRHGLIDVQGVLDVIRSQ